jgi:uncharacterized protein (TIGR03067 family)
MASPEQGKNDWNEPRQDEIKQLGGKWSMIMGERDGQQVPEATVNRSTREATGNVTTITIAGKLWFKAKFTVDPTKDPKTIDYEILEGSDKGKFQHGIYALNGDRVRFCLSEPDKPRPTEFNSVPGSGWTLSEWKQVTASKVAIEDNRHVPGGVFAYEHKGTVKSVDAEKMELIVTDEKGQDQTVIVANDVQVVGPHLNPHVRGLKSPMLQPGASVTIIYETKEGHVIASKVHITKGK